MKYQYYKNNYLIMTFYPEEKILKIETNNNINTIGSMDEKYVTYVIKSNELGGGSTTIKISSNKFYNFGFARSRLSLNIHNVEKDNIIKYMNGFIIN